VRCAGFAVLLLVAVGCGPQPNGTAPGAGADGDAVASAARAPDCEELRAAPAVEAAISEDAEVAAAQRRRAQMGLASDEATVAQILETTDGPYSFDFPHTDEEFDALMARNDPGVDPGKVRAWAYAEAGDLYAGLWLDHQSGGVLTVAFTDDVEGLRAEAAERFDAEIAVVEAAHSLAELQALQAEISAEVGAAGGEPVQGDITGIGIPEDLNRVSVGAMGGAQTAAAISERFGTERICLELQEPPGPEHAEIAGWAPAGDAPVDPAATEIAVAVYERACASGEPATGRIAEPDITYGDDEVVVTIRVIPRAGDQGCPGNPATAFTLQLDEPLGDRTLLDGGQDPPAPPTVDN
jgi:hypothetical protein